MQYTQNLKKFKVILINEEMCTFQIPIIEYHSERRESGLSKNRHVAKGLWDLLLQLQGCRKYTNEVLLADKLLKDLRNEGRRSWATHEGLIWIKILRPENQNRFKDLAK